VTYKLKYSKYEAVLWYVHVPTLNMIEKGRVSEYGQAVHSHATS